MSPDLLHFFMKALHVGLPLGVCIHKINGEILPTMEVYEMEEGQ